jgi:hypothetical protein
VIMVQSSDQTMGEIAICLKFMKRTKQSVVLKMGKKLTRSEL